MTACPDHVSPPADSLFEPVDGPRGTRLALVFGNEAPGGRCPFYQVQCAHCDLGEGEGIRFTPEINRARLAFFASHYADVMPRLNHLVIYNSGSTLNPLEMADETRDAILGLVNGLPAIERVSFDSREPFVTAERIQGMAGKLRTDINLGITLGLESQSEEIRMGHLAKRMTRAQVEEVFVALATVRSRTFADINLLFQPPGVLGSAAVNEAVATVRYGLELMKKYDVSVDFNFHPYYPSWKGTTQFPNHPRALVQDTVRALILLSREAKASGRDVRIFVGWNDEGHDLQPAVRQRELLLYDPGLKAFNISQDEADLRI